MKLASFDIFDTTLIRKCGVPENIFYLLSKHLYPENPVLQNSFFLWRREAEKKAMFRFCHSNLNLAQIYQEFDSLSFPEWNIDNLIEEEIKTEWINLIPVYEIKQLIAKKRSEGYVICFISDMYLPSKYLKDKLIAEGCALPTDRVFVSCEMNGTKSNGNLYDIVRNHYEDITVWEHYGDNLQSDYRKALKKGIKATLIKTEYTDLEKSVLASSVLLPFYMDLSVLIGLQRATRLSLAGKSDDIENAADLIVSLYLPYVMFILQKAKESGIKKLYFLSRDSYILQQAAEALHKDYLDVELHYLFVSRYSLFLPSIYTLSREELYENKGIFPFYRYNVKVADILKNLRINKEDFGEAFTRQITFSQISTPEEEDLFFQVLQSPEIKDKILRKACEERKILLDYFEQEGMLDNEKQALVDVGWIGTSRLMINRILEKERLQQSFTFYLGCASDCLPARYGRYYSFYGDNLYKPSIVALLEQYYSASPYASTKGYHYDINGKVAVDFKERKFMPSQEVVESNVKTFRHFLWLADSYCLSDYSKAMSVWGSMFLQTFLDMRCKLKLSTFNKLGIYEDGLRCYRVLQKVNIFQFFSYFYKGKIKHIYFPRHSIYYTYKITVCKPENSFREKKRHFVKNYLRPYKAKIFRILKWRKK